MTSDPGSISLYVFILVLTVIINAVIAAMNTAFGSVNANTVFRKAEDESDVVAQRAASILRKSFRCMYTNRMLSYILLVSGILVSTLLPYNDYISAALYMLLMLTMGELFPRKIGILHAESIVRSMGALQRALMIVFYPLVFLLTVFTDLILRIFRQETRIEVSRYSEEEVMSILEAGQESGEIKEEGKKMINSIFEFDDELAYEIMTPRTDVFMIDINDPPEEYLDELMELRYSRIPVCEDESDNVIGILHIKDYLIKAREDGFDNVDIMPILRTPYFVPETKNIDALFFELQKERQHIAILIDEYGGFSGIVTMEDIIEEVMGDIDDEFDKSEESYKKINDNTYIINGKEDLDDINDELGTNLESDNSETIGGLIIDLLGEIPGEEDRNRVVRYRNYNFTILRVKERRIEAVRMEILQPNRSEDDESDE